MNNNTRLPRSAVRSFGSISLTHKSGRHQQSKPAGSHHAMPCHGRTGWLVGWFGSIIISMIIDSEGSVDQDLVCEISWVSGGSDSVFGVPLHTMVDC